jgi:PAS domain S-box-containing protein
MLDLNPHALSFGQLFDKSPDAVVVASADTGCIALWNPAAELLFGYRAQEAVGCPMEMLLPADQREQHQLGPRRHGPGARGVFAGKSVPVEVTAQRKNGQRIEVEMTVSPIQIPRSQGRFVVAIIRDVSPRRRAEESAQLYAAIARHMPAGLYVYHLEDPDDDRMLRLIATNPAAETLTGRSEASVLGKTLDENFPRLRDQGLPQAFAEVANGGAGREWEESFYGDDHLVERAFAFKAFPLPNRCVGVTFENVTPRRVAEQMRARLAEALEEQNQQLKELDRVKSLLLNQVSHELRTPLTSLMGYAELLEDHVGGPLTDEQTKFVKQIERSTLRLQRLVDDLLDFARIEAGTFRLNLEDHDMVAKVQEITESLALQAQEAGLVVHTELPETPVTLRMDPVRVGQVLINLINNAIKFTPRGGHVTVRVHPQGDTVRCEVADTGPGIAPADQTKLFVRFSQLAAGARHGGTGLGLSICKALVDAHGGHIGVESREGEGATFWFELPKEPPADAASEGGAGRQQETPGTSPG